MKKSGVDRKEIFLETKLWPAFYEQADVVDQIKEILDICEVQPAILQTEVHPYFQEKELKKYLEKEKKWTDRILFVIY